MPDVTAALITGPERLEWRHFPDEKPPPGCVRVDVTLCGICGTEISSYRHGHLHSPAVCGHEWVGVVTEVGDGVDGERVGRRVVAGAPGPPCL